MTAFWKAWNDGDGPAAVAAWPAFRAAFAALAATVARGARRWPALPELAAGLVKFAGRQL